MSDIDLGAVGNTKEKKSLPSKKLNCYSLHALSHLMFLTTL